MRTCWLYTDKGHTTTPGASCLTLCEQCVGSLMSPANHITLKIKETGHTAYSPYPRRLECLTICRCDYKGSTFSSVILRPWVLLVRSGFEPTISRSAVRRIPNWANQAAVCWAKKKKKIEKKANYRNVLEPFSWHLYYTPFYSYCQLQFLTKLWWIV